MSILQEFINDFKRLKKSFFNNNTSYTHQTYKETKTKTTTETFEVSGRNVSIGKRVIVDGVDYTEEAENRVIVITGSVERLNVPACKSIVVEGDVDECKTSSGNVNVAGSVSSNVTTMSGDVSVNGDIYGNVKTMSGDIKRIAKFH